MKNKGKGNKLGDLIWPEIMKICSKTRGSKELDLLEVGSMKESWPYDEKGNPKDGYAVEIEEVIRKYREGKDERRKGWK